MNRIPILCIALLMTTVITLQMTALQKHIIYLPADDGQMKTRPAGFPDTVPMVVSLEEADRRFREKYKDGLPEIPERDHSTCLFNNCDWDLAWFLLKYEVVDFFTG